MVVVKSIRWYLLVVFYNYTAQFKLVKTFKPSIACKKQKQKHNLKLDSKTIKDCNNIFNVLLSWNVRF